MCRLFGLSGAPGQVSAAFWLLDASDSLAAQSRREPDGTGLGTFTDRVAVVEKRPLPAYQDRRFVEEARHRRSRTFVAHVRLASTGGLSDVNTHPFKQNGRLFAHNGVLGDLPTLENELGAHRTLVHGDTDSERLFALITRRIDEHRGDVTAGIVDAVRWVAEHVPVYAVNLVLTTATELWALRYPATHELFVLERGPGGPSGRRHLDHASPAGTIRVRSAQLRERPCVVVASERMDEDPGWTPLRSGELLHVDGQLRVTREVALPDPPRMPLTLAELGHVAASQT